MCILIRSKKIFIYQYRYLEKQYTKGIDLKLNKQPIYSPITMKCKNSSVRNLTTAKCELFIEKQDEDGFRYLVASPDVDQIDGIF